MKRGFTLVELSIVLVIIGLLIGGILVAKSMIDTSRITRTVKMMNEFDVAVSNFWTKFNQLPGDSNLFPNPGNNNKQIANYDTGYFWSHLSLGVGLKNAKGNNYIAFDYLTIPLTSEDYCPRFPLDNNPSTQPCYGPAYLWHAGTTTLTNLMTYSKGSPVVSGADYVLKPITMKALDSKIDDGLANSGNFGNLGAASCNSGGTYVLSNTNYDCTMSFVMGSLSGLVKGPGQTP